MVQSVNTFPHLHVQDKNLFFNSTKHISLNLDAEVFERDTDLNKTEILRELKNALFSSRELDAPFLTLFSSPVSAVTLPVQGRILASIPQEAEFFSFVHPCAVETLKARSDLANNAKQRMDQDSAIDVDMLVDDARAKYQKVVQQLNMNDPLVRFLVDGAFLYLDFKYDIVAINAVCLGDYSYLSSGNAGPGNAGYSACIRALLEGNDKKAALDCASLMIKYFVNVQENPHEEKYRRVPKGNKAFKARVAACAGSAALLQARQVV